MIATRSVKPSAAEFRPLAPLLQAIVPEKLNAARLRVAGLNRDMLIDSYQSAFVNGRRLTMFILAAGETGHPALFPARPSLTASVKP